MSDVEKNLVEGLKNFVKKLEAGETIQATEVRKVEGVYEKRIVELKANKDTREE